MTSARKQWSPTRGHTIATMFRSSRIGCADRRCSTPPNGKGSAQYWGLSATNMRSDDSLRDGLTANLAILASGIYWESKWIPNKSRMLRAEILSNYCSFRSSVFATDFTQGTRDLIRKLVCCNCSIVDMPHLLLFPKNKCHIRQEDEEHRNDRFSNKPVGNSIAWSYCGDQSAAIPFIFRHFTVEARLSRMSLAGTGKHGESKELRIASNGTVVSFEA